MNNAHLISKAVLLAVVLAAPCVVAVPGSAAQAQGKASAQTEGKASAQTESKVAGGNRESAPSQPPAQESASNSGPGQGTTAPAQAAVTAQAQAEAEVAARMEARKRLEAVKQRGAKVSSEARSKAEAKLAAVATKTNEDAAVQGSATVAGRLAAEFGMSADQLMAEHQALGCSWGELMIAHSLDANTTADITVAQLLELRKEGTGWGQIAAGLGFKLGQVVSAVQAEGRVAAGLARPDGRVAGIRGEGVRAGVGAGASAAVPAGGASATAQTGVGVGIKIKP